MKPEHQKVLDRAVRALALKESSVLELWNAEKPHFGVSQGPHRYEGYDAASDERLCEYCMRPESYEPPEKADEPFTYEVSIKPPPHPECEKFAAVRERAITIIDFLNWLEDQELNICTYDTGTDQWFPWAATEEGFLMKYAEVDPAKLEQERRALLDYQRALNEAADAARKEQG